MVLRLTPPDASGTSEPPGSIFYTVADCDPTFIPLGDEHPTSTTFLRCPCWQRRRAINPEACIWYHRVIAASLSDRRYLVQTETGES